MEGNNPTSSRKCNTGHFPRPGGEMAGRRDFRPPGAGDSGPGTAGVPSRESLSALSGRRRTAAGAGRVRPEPGRPRRRNPVHPLPARPSAPSGGGRGPAVSGRAGLAEHPVGRPVAGHPARSRARAVLHPSHLIVADRPQVRPLRQVPPRQPVVCPVWPRSRECWGVGRKNPAFSASATPAWSANSLPLSAVIVWTGVSDGRGIAGIAAETAAEVRRPALREYVYSGARSTRETTAPLWPFPMIVSASRSPTRSLLSTSAGLPEMSTRPGMWPRPECRPPLQFGFPPRRRSSGNSPPPAFLSASDTRMSTGGPPPSRPPARAVPRSAPGSSPPPATHRRPPGAPPSSSGGHWTPRCGAPPLSPAPRRGCSPNPRRSGAAPARPTGGHGPDGPRPPRSTARFPSARRSGISPHGSGGAGPRAWRSPSSRQGDCRRFLADPQHHAAAEPVTTATGVALRTGMGLIYKGVIPPSTLCCVQARWKPAFRPYLRWDFWQWGWRRVTPPVGVSSVMGEFGPFA